MDLWAVYRVPSHMIAKSAVSSPSASLVCLILGLLGVRGRLSMRETGDPLQCGVFGSALDCRGDFSTESMICRFAVGSNTNQGPRSCSERNTSGTISLRGRNDKSRFNPYVSERFITPLRQRVK